MAAARSSKDQWRAFLAELIDSADTTVLTPRDAFAALRKQFGEDVNARLRKKSKKRLSTRDERR